MCAQTKRFSLSMSLSIYIYICIDTHSNSQHKQWKDPKDPEKEPEIREHHCFTFTFGGDLDGVQAPGRDMNGAQKPGPVIAFTGSLP